MLSFVSNSLHADISTTQVLVSAFVFYASDGAPSNQGLGCLNA